MIGGAIEFTGLSASGKSSIAKRVATSLGVTFIDFADMLLSQSEHAGGQHDEILRWEPRSVDERVHAVQTKLGELSSEGHAYILETHMCPNVPNQGYKPTHPSKLQLRNTLGIVILLTSYEDALHFRKCRAAARDRIPPAREQFDLDNLATIAAGIALAAQQGVACYIHRNIRCDSESNIDPIIEVTKRWLQGAMLR